jgi:hypothetical protein
MSGPLVVQAVVAPVPRIAWCMLLLDTLTITPLFTAVLILDLLLGVHGPAPWAFPNSWARRCEPRASRSTCRGALLLSGKRSEGRGGVPAVTDTTPGG